MVDHVSSGYTKWARQTIDSDIFLKKPHVWFKIWFYLVNRANHADKGKYKRGECFLSYETICNATGATLDQTKKALGFMRDEHQISTKRSTRGTLITVNKYVYFQDSATYQKHQKSTREALEKHQRSTTINKNGKNEKHKEDIKQHIIPVEEPRKLTPIQEVVNFYKIEVEGVKPDDRKAINHDYRRYVREAKKLLEYFDGNIELTKKCISEVSQEFIGRELSFTINTIYKYADTWRRIQDDRH